MLIPQTKQEIMRAREDETACLRYHDKTDAKLAYLRLTHGAVPYADTSISG